MSAESVTFRRPNLDVILLVLADHKDWKAGIHGHGVG